jgi:DNA adenine methylase
MQVVMRDEFSKPIFRWAGSKRKLLPILIKNIPNSYNRYVEPFCGSACLFFAIQPKKAILGDMNSELISAYQTIRQYPCEVAKLASNIPNDKKTYFEIRAQHQDTLDVISRAVRFIYLNRYCFNGVYRTNLSGEFNVPMGSRTGGIPSELRFLHCAEALNTADLYSGDFETVFSHLKDGDFLYIDPPYSKPGSKHGGEYGPISFQYSDIERLLSFLNRSEQLGVNFLLSYSNDAGLIAALPNNWKIKDIKVKRHVSGFSQYRLDASEILISNNTIRI